MKASLGPALDGLTERVIGAAFAVHRTLGHGFAESVYKKAMLRECQEIGLNAASEVPFQVLYRGEKVGTYFSDIVVDNQVVVELKVCESIGQPQIRQVVNYLRVSQLPIGLLFNFAEPSLTVRRVLPPQKNP